MESIYQKKNGTIIEISFQEKGIDYSIKDKDASDSAFIPFERIPNTTNYFIERNQWWLNAGILWIIIGCIQTAILISDKKFGIPFWFFIGLGCVIWYFISTTKFTLIHSTSGQKIFLIKDKTHDEALKTLYAKRNEYLNKEYNKFTDGDYNTEDELGKFEWLKSLEVINEERFNEIKKSIDKKEVKD